MINVHRIAYFRVIALAFAAFIFNTTEFVPVALLSDIASDFSMQVSDTGLIITIYAWMVTILSLPFMLMTAKLERKRLLLNVFLLFVACHVLSAVAWDFWVLVLARIGIAASHAIFWSITASLAVRVAPINKGSQAIGLLALGTSLAMVLGLPLGRVVGDTFGWRVTFGLLAAFAAAETLLLYKILPLLPSRRAGSLKSLPLLAKKPLLMTLYALTVLIVSAHFTAYSYIEPFIKQLGANGGGFITIFLLIFGFSGIVASLLFGKFYKLIPNGFLIVSILFITASLLALNLLIKNETQMLLLAFVWGLGISGIGLSMQIKVLNLAPEATDVAMSIYSAIYNIGIGGGALIGHQVMTHLGLVRVGDAGAVFGACGLVLFCAALMKFKPAGKG
ncbi:sugar transporter [Campylobacter curvus]|uniref:Major facilitator superfamily transporter n=1 Tax=Campylobacter curvus (strain 525.92) TaxID=360105 RepID=A0A0M4SRK5_CAMC5|nr:sugar transporter [Campylobacter curvus]ALF45096.1 major facilitator superfamily transporter [Campylobacter curvus 525.92]